MSHYALADFVRECGEAVVQSQDPRSLVDALAEYLRRLLSGPLFLDDRLLHPSRGRIASQILHEDRERSFVVASCAWAPQQSSPIHGHRSWGVIGGVSNRVVATHYRRHDDGEIPGFADLSENSRVLISETSLALLRPPDELIHKIENPFRDAAITLHVFGDLQPWESVFDPPAKRMTTVPPEPDTVGI